MFLEFPFIIKKVLINIPVNTIVFEVILRSDDISHNCWLAICICKNSLIYQLKLYKGRCTNFFALSEREEQHETSSAIGGELFMEDEGFPTA